MADEKTEQPTPKRLRDARQKGDVPKSQEVPSAAIVLCIFGYFIAMGPSIFRDFSDLLDFILANAISRPYEETLKMMLPAAAALAVKIAAPVLGIAMAAALVGNIGQIGFLFAPKAAAPKLSNLSPSKWFKKVFSKKNAIEFAKNILKVAILSFAVYKALSSNLRELMALPSSSTPSMWIMAGGLMKELAIWCGGSFAAVAALDFVYTRLRYTKEHMMSIDEVKREYKEQEGDPLIKSKRRQLHQEMANQSAVASARKAKVLIVNPTHFAIAVDYDAEKTPLPVVLAKGQGDLARRMIEAAREEGVPVLRDVPLAHALFEEGVEGQSIPPDLLPAIAKILRYVQAVDR